MTKKLNLFSLKAGFNKVKIGSLSSEVISILKLNRPECDIIFWEDRLKHIEKHVPDFDSLEDYYKHMELIPDIIESPDYVGLHPSANSIEYFKRINKVMLVAIRLRNDGNLSFRTAYPISEAKLQVYIESGTVFEVKKERGERRKNIDRNA